MRVEKDYQYAHVMFAECVVHDPGNLTYVEALLQNLRLVHPISKSNRHPLLRVGTDRPLKQAIASKDFTRVFQVGVELLKANPWSSMTLRALAEVCSELHFNEVELVYLKQSLDVNPKDIDVNRHCIRSLARMGQFDQAIACWHRIEVLRPADKEPLRMIAQLQDEKQKYAGGRPPVTAQAREPAKGPVSVQEFVAEPTAPDLDPRRTFRASNFGKPTRRVELFGIG